MYFLGKLLFYGQNGLSVGVWDWGFTRVLRLSYERCLFTPKAVIWGTWLRGDQNPSWVASGSQREWQAARKSHTGFLCKPVKTIYG